MLFDFSYFKYIYTGFYPDYLGPYTLEKNTDCVVNGYDVLKY